MKQITNNFLLWERAKRLELGSLFRVLRQTPKLKGFYLSEGWGLSFGGGPLREKSDKYFETIFNLANTFCIINIEMFGGHETKLYLCYIKNQRIFLGRLKNSQG